MPRSAILRVLGLLAVLMAVPLTAQPLSDSTVFTTGLFRGCSPEGDGGDPALNRRKNRDMPPLSFDTMTVSQILNNKPQQAIAMGKAPRSQWTMSARAQVRLFENEGITVEGFLLQVKEEGPEACNCHSQTAHGFHIWLAANPGDTRARAVVIEVSPRLIPLHPLWRLDRINELVQNQLPVRISGWMMWDQEHPEQIGQTRGTLWEIHPIHRIEVQTGGQWREL